MDGSDVNIWEDKCFQPPTTFAVLSPIYILGKDVKVKALIDQDMHWWNISLIEKIFTKEVWVIYKLPVSSTFKKYLLIWKGITTRDFSVYSTYHIEKDRECSLRGESSIHSSEAKFGVLFERLMYPTQ